MKKLVIMSDNHGATNHIEKVRLESRDLLIIIFIVVILKVMMMLLMGLLQLPVIMIGDLL